MARRPELRRPAGDRFAAIIAAFGRSTLGAVPKRLTDTRSRLRVHRIFLCRAERIKRFVDVGSLLICASKRGCRARSVQLIGDVTSCRIRIPSRRVGTANGITIDGCTVFQPASHVVRPFCEVRTRSRIPGVTIDMPQASLAGRQRPPARSTRRWRWLLLAGCVLLLGARPRAALQA
jgi:hypothetical protein